MCYTALHYCCCRLKSSLGVLRSVIILTHFNFQVRLSTNNKRQWPSWIESTTHVAHSLMSLNSSVNFYVYCVKHFRDSCCPAKSGSSNNGLNQTLISTASGDHLMVHRVSGTPHSGTSSRNGSRNLNSETFNETVV